MSEAMRMEHPRPDRVHKIWCILMMAVRHNIHLPFNQKPDLVTDCAIRSVHIDGVTCSGENAMSIVGSNGNVKNVTLRNIDYTHKPSAFHFCVAPLFRVFHLQGASKERTRSKIRN